MIKADLTVTFSTVVESEEEAEEYFEDVVFNFNRNDYEIENEETEVIEE